MGQCPLAPRKGLETYLCMDRRQSEARICSARGMRLLTAANSEARLRNASTSTQNRKWKSLLLLLVTLSDGERPGGDAWPRRIDSRGPSGLERRAKPPGCLARSRRSQTRRAGCNGSGLWWRRSSHQATTFHRARQQSSTPLIAAACSAGMLPGRKGTASTACAAACDSAAAH